MELNDDYLSRFGGIGRLYGTAALPKLAAAHVCVIGVGGVGSWVVEALARTGIGALTLVDLDDVCITNTNRQLPALTGTAGRPKVEVLAERVRGINPECEVIAAAEFLTETSASRLLAPQFDFVVDAVDRMSVKALIIGTCHARNMPVITVGSAGGRRDPTLIRATDLGHAGRDPLLKQTRRKLRRDFGFPRSPDGDALPMGVPCVFSTETPVFPQADGSCALEPEPGSDESLRLDCAGGFGAATFVTGAFAFVAAAEVVKRLAAV
ncbi:MAG: tRNA threonylcarbamoyladenosine dehydratase [Verrucomicrobiaceae bacterium]|nr:tRNA threonylcarbamoyladenosine dehydratase [Verrucomicrobiaceae bacterium]